MIPGLEEAGACFGQRVGTGFDNRVMNQPDPVAALKDLLSEARADEESKLTRQGALASDIAAWRRGFDRAADIDIGIVERAVLKRQGEPVPENCELRASLEEGAMIDRVAQAHGIADIDKYRILIGLRAGRDQLVPYILAPAAGRDAAAIDAWMAERREVWRQDQCFSPAFQPEHAEMVWLGVLAATEQAKQTLLATLKAEEAQDLMLRSLTAIGDAATMLSAITEPEPPRRKLTPADFGVHVPGLPPTAPELIELARQMGGEAAQAAFETLSAPNVGYSPRALRRALPKAMRQCLDGLCLKLRKQDLRSAAEIAAYREGFEAERDRLLAGTATASAPQ